MAAGLSTDSGAEVIVIGSGAGGAAIAGEVARRGISVLLLEAGSQLSDRPGRNLRNEYAGEDQLERFNSLIDLTLGNPANAVEGIAGLPGTVASHGVGGMLVHWTGHCPDQHPRLERPTCIPDLDWGPLLSRAARLLRVDRDAYAGSHRQQRLLERLGEFMNEGLPADRRVQPMPIAAERREGETIYTGADDLLLDDAGQLPASLRVVPNAIVRRLRQQDGRVAAAEVGQAGEPGVVTVYGSIFIVSGGTVGTPQLLVASEVETRPALGRFLMEHPMFASRLVLREELRAGVPADDTPFAIWVPLSEDRPWHTQIVRFPAQYSPVPPPYQPRDTADLFCFSSVDPRPDNQIVFEPDRLDPFGMPQPRIEFSLSLADRRRFAAGIADQFMIASELADLHAGWAPQMLTMGGSTHLMGSTRIGAADDGDSVADTTGRVWGQQNLFVAGNGVFPSTNACNPTLTTVAIALRTADAVIADLQGSRGTGSDRAASESITHPSA